MQRIKTFLFAGVTALAAVLAQSSTVSAQSPPQIFKGAPPAAWSFDGLFVSLSAGGTLTHGSVGQSGNEPYTETQQYFSGGALTQTYLTTATDTFSTNTTGNGAGAVFTFSGGYNVVLRNNWLVGVQPEASWNLSKTRLTGSGSGSSSYTTTQTFPAPPGTPSTSTYSQTYTQQDTLKNDWTVSLLARGGYVLNNDWLFYGLLGWSWGGFDLDEGDQVFVMNGFTYGGGVEKNFGWLRAFVQVKPSTTVM
jgi:hypothetical protein